MRLKVVLTYKFMIPVVHCRPQRNMVYIMNIHRLLTMNLTEEGHKKLPPDTTKILCTPLQLRLVHFITMKPP